jgi:hypothetical protein
VVTTDSIRNMMRSFHPQDEHPLVWASTYQAGEPPLPLAGADGGWPWLLLLRCCCCCCRCW